MDAHLDKGAGLIPNGINNKTLIMWRSWFDGSSHSQISNADV